MKRIILAVIALGLASLACGTSAPVAPSDRCIPASLAQMELIRAGIKDIEQRNNVNNGFAVLSNDQKGMWFVAAEITGPGILKNTIGLWAIPGELDTPNTNVLSVDGFAGSFSSWPDGTKTDAKLTMFEDGAQEALSCAKH